MDITIMIFRATFLATTMPLWKYRFSSDHWSQAAFHPVSTWMGDHQGTPGAVGSTFFSHFLGSDFEEEFISAIHACQTNIIETKQTLHLNFDKKGYTHDDFQS
jgi:hypothetical protein